MIEVTLKEVQEEIKQLIIDRLKEVEQIVAQRYQIKDFDDSFASDDAEVCIRKLTKLYKNSILNDRAWVSENKKYNVEVYSR